MFEIKNQQFNGPLDKLLSLVEEKRLAITAVNLAEVTVEFLAYLKTLEQKIPPADLADFLVVAAKLVLIKSKVLVPDLTLTEEEEHEIADLETRLVIYREFAAREGSASAHLGKQWQGRTIAFSRPLLASLRGARFFYPGTNLTGAGLAGAMAEFAMTVQELMPRTDSIKTTIISLEEKIRELLARCTQAARESFRNISGRRPRAEVIVMFLALLHLLKAKTLSVSQEENFGDIVIAGTQREH